VPDRMLSSDAEQAVHEGIVSVRDLSRYTPQILRAVEKLGKAVLITRHGRIIATLAPVDARRLIDRALERDTDLQQSLDEAHEERTRRTQGRRRS
jgi:antitoxin (DNA-binding transcriptional repressor) of toxin-antitoxin stability system